jgi:hypothetical protein
MPLRIHKEDPRRPQLLAHIRHNLDDALDGLRMLGARRAAHILAQAIADIQAACSWVATTESDEP